MEGMQKEILFSRDDINQRITELAADISRDYAGKELVVVGVLKGAFVFMADLIRRLQTPCVIDFARLASYGAGSTSSGQIVITKDIEMEIKDRDVLIVEDIVDTGLTLSYLVQAFKERRPRSLKVCAFMDKRLRRKVAFEADYVGFTIDDGFVVGYGLDFNEKARFFPDVYIVTNL
ncbi:MAG: hypoxanthine phosphoribosyltransferase [Syntrophales bacterium]|jgi:hypoxanthine phosphoribosyltransferase|nr:hypoxanthine phosphoribosyltransferase [Syntrophales bacterium]